jgi:hypothetical protein
MNAAPAGVPPQRAPEGDSKLSNLVPTTQNQSTPIQNSGANTAPESESEMGGLTAEEYYMGFEMDADYFADIRDELELFEEDEGILGGNDYSVTQESSPLELLKEWKKLFHAWEGVKGTAQNKRYDSKRHFERLSMYFCIFQDFSSLHNIAGRV